VRLGRGSAVWLRLERLDFARLALEHLPETR
jgi:hypothetical protein